MLPLHEIQRAIYDKLVPVLAPVPVLDNAGPDQSFPYVTIGEFISLPQDTLDKAGVNSELTVHTWSRQLGMAETSGLMAAVWDTLHRQDLSFPTCQFVAMRCENAQTMRDADGRTRHGIVRVIVGTFQN